MSFELEIHWDGDAPGLAESEFSVSTWASALSALLDAARSYSVGADTRRGRPSMRERQLDFVLTATKPGSVTTCLRVVKRPTSSGQVETDATAENWVAEAMTGLLNGLREASGGRIPSVLSKYVELTAQGISTHECRFLRDGQVYETVKFDAGAKTHADAVDHKRASVRGRGRVLSVTFGPDTTIKVELEGQRPFTMTATAEQVESAIANRADAEVMATFPRGQSHARCVWIGSPITSPRRGKLGEGTALLLIHHKQALDILAQ